MKDAKLGFLPAISIVVANMVGVGVFTSLGFQLLDLTDYRSVLALWIIGGVLALLGSFCYAELSSSYPQSGGEYHFLRISFGNHAGFLSGWTSAIVGFAAPIAASAHAFSVYFSNVVHTGVNPLFISSGLIVAITLVHSISVRVGSGFQVYFTIGKVLIMLFFILAGLYFTRGQTPVATPDGAPFRTEGLGSDFLDKGFWIGLIFVSYAYSGWNASAYMIDDIRNPVKNVPRSILAGTLVVMVLYTSINWVFLKSAPVSELRGVQDVADVSARHLFGESGARMISGLISFFLVSTISSMIIVGPRVIRRISQDYTAFSFFAADAEGNVPRRALYLQSGIALAILLTSSFESIITGIGFILTLFTTLTAAAVILLRRRDPDRLRPVKTPLYPIVPILYIFFNLWILYYTILNRPSHVITGAAFLALGSLCYLWVRRDRPYRVTTLVSTVFLAFGAQA